MIISKVSKASSRLKLKRESKKKQLGDVEFYSSYVLLAQARHAIRKVRQRELGRFRITVDQSSVLACMKDLGSESTVGEISSRILREKHTIFEILSRMEEKGLIQKIKETGKKKVKYRLTAKGAEISKKESSNRHSIQNIFSSLDKDERIQFKRLLYKLLKKTLKELGPEYKMPPLIKESR